MKHRPILFNGEMVLAILDGRKSQTRRIIKPQPEGSNPIVVFARTEQTATHWRSLVNGNCEETARIYQCPYGQPGDRLWVRESWRIGAWDEDDGTIAIDYCDGPRREWLPIPDDDGEKFNRYWISCCDELARKRIDPGTDGRYHWEPGQSPLRWRPSIHMPRWASRITLEIVSVRVERLQDISETDAMAEGIDMESDHASLCINIEDRICGPGDSDLFKGSAILTVWRKLWRDINGWESWDANPWVWVIEFQKVAQA